jgi:cytochrome P450
LKLGDSHHKAPIASFSKKCPGHAAEGSIENTESCPRQTHEVFQKQETEGCPYLASKQRLEQAAALTKADENQQKAKALGRVGAGTAKMAAVATPAGPSTLAIAKGLGLEFRSKGRGIDFWRTKWKDLSPERAVELAAGYKDFQARSAQGDWSPVGSIEELQQLVQRSEKEAKIAAQLATAGATAQQVSDSLSGLPVVGMGTDPGLVEPAKGPKKLGLVSFARGMLRHYNNPLSFLQEFHAKNGRSFQVNTPTHGKFLFDTRTDILVDALNETDGKDDRWKKSELQTHGASFLIGKKNMFASGGEDWKVIHDGIAPHLSTKKINSPQMISKLTGIFDDHISDLKTRVAAAPNGELEIDARSEMQTAVLDVALQVFLSTKMPKSELKELQGAFNTQMSWLPEETVNPTNISLANLPGNKKLRNAYKSLDQVAQRILDTRKAAKEKPGDMLDSFIAAVDPQTGEPFSDERVKHEILSLLEAGHETTATMLGWSMLMMSRNPKEYAALQKDVDQVVGRQKPQNDDLKDLDRADNIVKETLRMYPPFYLFMRQAKEDVTLGKPGQEIQVEKGTTIVSSIYETHRDEALWGEEKTGFPANEFHSARFDQRPPEKFIPFGAGKRSCTGRVLGKLEGSLMLTRMAQAFDIKPDDHPIDMQSDLSIHPKDGKITLKLRSDQSDK